MTAIAATSEADASPATAWMETHCTAALPELHAVVAVSGHRPMVATLEPWWESELANAVNESLQLWGPQGEPQDAPRPAV